MSPFDIKFTYTYRFTDIKYCDTRFGWTADCLNPFTGRLYETF